MIVDNNLGVRAWSVLARKMFPVSALHFTMAGTLVKSGGHDVGYASCENGAVHGCDVVLMKYAGVKDIDGVKLHDQDIITWGYDDGDPNFTAKVVYADFETRGDLDLGQRHVGFMIEFNDHGGEDHLRYSDLPNADRKFKIVGNTFENPELWEAS